MKFLVIILNKELFEYCEKNDNFNLELNDFPNNL